MSLHHLELTTALRPSLLPDETLLFVQDGVGLYEGKFKIPNFQNGQVYLTSHRACYVDNEDSRKHSVAINLKDVERYEFYAGFLKSSPKITLHLKPSKRHSRSLGSLAARTDNFRNGSPLGSASVAPDTSSPSSLVSPPKSSATWICPTCSFSNPVPSNLDPTSNISESAIPPCLACGIKPPRLHILKAVIAGNSQRSVPPTSQDESALDGSFITSASVVNDTDAHNGHGLSSASPSSSSRAADSTTLPCPRCTFLNHPSLSTCEICGALLKNKSISRGNLLPPERIESSGPMLSAATPVEGTAPDNIRLSFRAGGEKSFYERLKNAMVQRKWLLEGAPSPPVPSQPVPSSMPSKFSSPDSSHSRTYVDQQRTVGIAGLKARSLATREKNSVAISTAFEDLEALMTSAKEIIALAESFSSHLPSSNTSASSNEATQLLAQSTSALGLITTKDSSESSLYHSLLARTLADLLTDDATGILKREGGIISLVDLWALFNRARGGVELVSPSDFLKACEMFEKLKLPLRLRRFKSGLLAVQGSDMEDSKIIARVKAWLETPADEVPDTVQLQFGRGVTPREAAERFGWSVGVAREELEMAEEKGAVCREEGVGGVRFWINWIVQVD